MSSPDVIDNAAAVWAVRQREGPLSDDDQVRFEAWIAADSRHLGAFVRMSAVQVDLQRLAAVSGGAEQREPAERKHRQPLLWAAAAALVLAVGSGTLWLANLRGGDEYISGIGELREISLVDGSRMTLNTATATRVQFSEAAREVEMDRGEALFRVAHDPGRPFIVRAGSVRVRAVGTAFAVKMEGAHVDVTVTEGTVEVSDATVANAKAQRVSARQRVTASDVGFVKVEPLKPEAIDRALAWRQGMVAFNGESLAEAIAVLNRHNHKRLTVNDPAIASRSITGMFRADDIETFAKTAAAITDAQVVEDDDGLRLEAKSAR